MLINQLKESELSCRKLIPPVYNNYILYYSTV